MRLESSVASSPGVVDYRLFNDGIDYPSFSSACPERLPNEILTCLRGRVCLRCRLRRGSRLRVSDPCPARHLSRRKAVVEPGDLLIAINGQKLTGTNFSFEGALEVCSKASLPR